MNSISQSDIMNGGNIETWQIAVAVIVVLILCCCSEEKIVI